ncbi:MAG: hypothetical protein GX956_04765 [Firmicutes bacterium]|nr:hypothetical protein [Bacillota bacterium]
MEYLGLDDDKIGPWSIPSPDGSSDGHFQVSVYFPKEVEVKNLRLYKLNYQGEKLESYWFSDLAEAWILGVFRYGKMLNPNREDSLGSFGGRVLFDI